MYCNDYLFKFYFVLPSPTFPHQIPLTHVIIDPMLEVVQLGQTLKFVMSILMHDE